MTHIEPKPEQDPWSGLREALRRAASALAAEGRPFALAGSYALWVHGAPEPLHDVDLVVEESDADAVAETLTRAGFTVERPLESWLLKAYWDGALVDVLHRVNGVPVDAALIEASPSYDVLAIPMRVLEPTTALTQKLLALNEHHCDFEPLLPRLRAVREQVDWPKLRDATKDNDFAAALLFLADRMGIAPTA